MSEPGTEEEPKVDQEDAAEAEASTADALPPPQASARAEEAGGSSPDPPPTVLEFSASLIVQEALALEPLTAEDIAALLHNTPASDLEAKDSEQPANANAENGAKAQSEPAGGPSPGSSGGSLAAGAASAGLAACVSRLQTHPFDAEAWARLIAEARATGFKVRECLELATRQFPTSGRAWADLIAHTLQQAVSEATQEATGEANAKQAEAEAEADRLWGRGMRLTGFASLDLWRLRLDRSVERYARVAQERLAAAREHRQALGQELVRWRNARDACVKDFEGVLERCGGDFLAAPLWERYLQFVKGWPCGPADSTPQERTERTRQLRAVYQLATTLPLKGINELWQGYDRFERREVEGNEVLGAQMLEKQRPAYRVAAQQAKARGQAWEPTGQTTSLATRLAMLPVPPWGPFSGSGAALWATAEAQKGTSDARALRDPNEYLAQQSQQSGLCGQQG